MNKKFKHKDANLFDSLVERFNKLSNTDIDTLNPDIKWCRLLLKSLKDFASNVLQDSREYISIKKPIKLKYDGITYEIHRFTDVCYNSINGSYFTTNDLLAYVDDFSVLYQLFKDLIIESNNFEVKKFQKGDV